MKYIFQIVIGLGLIASGVFHQLSMQIFEIRMYELLGFDWLIFPVLGRIWSGLEMYLGLSLILNVNPKKVHTYILMVISSFVLYDAIWDSFFNENHLYIEIWPFYKIFGEKFAYFKLILALIMVAYVIYDLKKGKATDFKWKWIKFVYLVGAFSYTFIYNAFLPRDLTYAESAHNSSIGILEINEHIKEGYELIPEKDKVVLMFVSLSCSHCLNATKKMAAIKRKNPELDVRLVLFADKNIALFREYANAPDIPHSVVNGKTFIEVTGGSVPQILYVENGEIKRQWDAKSGSFNYEALSFVQHLK
ncbi:MAG: hypothetical protein R2799_09815 [Crocinitomicaceae bacterium]